MSKNIKPKCPRCDSTDTRAEKKSSLILCRRCGYSGHWRQFFEGQREREKAIKLIEKGIIEGKIIQ